MRICRVVAKMIDRNVTLNDAIQSVLGYSRMKTLILPVFGAVSQLGVIRFDIRVQTRMMSLVLVLQGVRSKTAMRCHIEWLVAHARL